MDWYTVERPFVVPRRGKYVCFYSGGRWENPNYGVGYLAAGRPMGEGGVNDNSWRNPANARGPVVLRTDPAVVGPGSC